MAIREEVDPLVLEGQELIAQTEDSLMDEFTPTGNFSKKVLNSLVKATQKMQPLFGLKADYPTFNQDVEQLPTEFTRVLMMFKQAIDDAVAQDIVSEDNTFILDDVVDDSGLQLIAGKLGAVVKDKAFKKFLETPDVSQEPVQDEAPTIDEERTPSPDNMDDSLDELFGERI